MVKQQTALWILGVLLSCGLEVDAATAQQLLPRPNTAASVPQEIESDEPCALTAYVLYEADGKNGYLVVKAKIAEGHHLYSLTQPGGSATKIEVAKNESFEIAGVFRPTKAPQVDGDPQSPGRHEIHAEEVEFYLPIKLTKGMIPNEVVINVRVNGQVCSDSTCVPISNKVLTAKYGDVMSLQDKRYQGQNTQLPSNEPIRLK